MDNDLTVDSKGVVLVKTPKGKVKAPFRLDSQGTITFPIKDRRGRAPGQKIVAVSLRDLAKAVSFN